MKLLFMDLIDWNYSVDLPLLKPCGGSQSALCYLATELARRGHNITLVNGVNEERTVLGVHSLPVRDFTESVARLPWDAVILMNGPADQGIRLRKAVNPSVPIILWTQHASNQPAMKPLEHDFVRQSWDRVLCVSNWHREQFLADFHVDPSQIGFIRNAIAPCFENLFADAQSLQEAKSGHPVAVYTSTPYRGLSVLLDAWPDVHWQHPQATLAVYSSMAVYQTTKDPWKWMYEKCEEMPGFRYVGGLTQAKLAGALRTAHVLAYPSIFEETYATTISESLAAGLFVLTVNLGALSETCGIFGGLTTPGDDLANRFGNELAKIFRNISKRPGEFADQMMDQVKEVNRTCTWRVRADEWEEEIESVRRQFKAIASCS